MAAFAEHECTDPDEVEETTVADCKNREVEENLCDQEDTVDTLVRISVQ